MNEYDGTSAATHVAYEAKRAARQMNHFFNVNDYKRRTEQSAQGGGANTAAVKKKPTKKEIEQFKRKKEEKKKTKNKWLYE